MCSRRVLAFPLLAALAAAAGCGSSREEELRDEWRRRCDAIVPGTTTIADADLQFRPFNPVPFPCDAPGGGSFFPVSQPDVCAYGGAERVCEWAWQQDTRTLCGPAGGCTFRCTVRVMGREQAFADNLQKTICAREFLDEQPFFLKASE